MALTLVSQPLRLGPIEIKNRTSLGGPASLSDDFLAYHLERAKGGCALTILEAASVHPTSMVHYGLFEDSVIPGFQRLAKAVKPHGMKVLQQLWYGGNLYRGAGGATPISVSTRPGYMGVVGRAATADDIRMLVEAYVQAALRCREGGLDGVEIHAGHGYSFSQFLSSAYNDRTDEYGGPIENRARFLLETLRAVRAATGPEFAVGLRLSASEAPNFLSAAENRQVIGLVQAEGLADYLNVSFGDYYKMETMVGGLNRPMGYELDAASEILSAAKVPRMVAGRFRALDEAETVLREGIADMVSMVRAQIADPHLVRKTLEGKPEEVRPCIACNQGCVGKPTGRIGCTVNPTAGFEAELREDNLPRPATPKTVLVVGGGPAGLEAARTAAAMGHRVVLAEAAPKLGGQVVASRRAPGLHIFGDALQWLEDEVYRLGVEVRLGAYMDADDVRALAPDAVVIATGAEPRTDGFQLDAPGEPVIGVDLPHVASSVDVLTGANHLEGRSALVVDGIGGYEAVAVAEHFFNQGKAVTFVTHLSDFGPINDWRSTRALERMDRGDFTLLTRHQLREIRPGECLVRRAYAPQDKVIAAEAVVLVAPKVPRQDLYSALLGEVAQLALVGDAMSPRDMQFAISEGHRAARAIL
jgi:2,4-dienoyl-CoA reductase-like NADH-dependent reductase (Old Yellow Enzyme family)/thioredoxin reductase